MSKRRPIQKKQTNQNQFTSTPRIPTNQNYNPIVPDVPSSLKALRTFEGLLEATLYTKPRTIAYFCFSVSLLLPLFATYFPFIREYRVAKDNFLNVYFVKFGWAWTLFVVGLYVAISSAIYTLMSATLMVKHLGRLVVSTAMWYLGTTGFNLIQELTGLCSNTTIQTMDMCLQNNDIWTEFDVSGHSFLLTFCLLVTVEEFKTSKYIYWDSLEGAFERKKMRKTFSFVLFENTEKLILLLKLAALLLLFIWQWMLITSSLFYHTFSENLSGTICGIVSWLVTYVACFHEQKYLTYPGDGVLRGYFRECSDLK